MKVVGAALIALGTAACVSGPLPPGTLVQSGPGAFLPPPPPRYAPPPRRCYYQDGPYGPERVCRRPDYYY